MVSNKLVLVNYSNKRFKKLQAINSKTAKLIGDVDKVFSYGPKDIDPCFYRNNSKILNETKGNGLWLWKPYFILKTFESLEIGDYLFYSDAGAYFVDSLRKIVKISEKSAQDVLPFDVNFPDQVYTKRDVFLHLNCDSKEFTETKMRMGGFILLRKSNLSVNFVKEWLYYCKNYQLLSDSENISGAANYSNFITHRHDQSLFSVLSKKYKFESFRDPSQYGNYEYSNYLNSKSYGQIIQLTRLNFNLKEKFRYVFLLLMHLFKLK